MVLGRGEGLARGGRLSGRLLRAVDGSFELRTLRFQCRCSQARGAKPKKKTYNYSYTQTILTKPKHKRAFAHRKKLPITEKNS